MGLVSNRSDHLTADHIWSRLMPLTEGVRKGSGSFGISGAVRLGEMFCGSISGPGISIRLAGFPMQVLSSGVWVDGNLQKSGLQIGCSAV